MHVVVPVLHRPSKPTGVCRHAVNLALCLSETEPIECVTLVIGDWQKTYFSTAFDLTSPKINIVSVSIKNRTLTRNLWYLRGLPQLVNSLQPDIVHLSFPIPFVRSRFQAPVVATIHDLYPYECPDNFGYPQVWFNQCFLKQCIRASDGLACVSQCTLGTLKTYFPNAPDHKKVDVIYNVVEFSQASPERPHQLTSHNNGPLLMTVAQHRKNKNLDLLIQAFSALIQAGQVKPNSRLVLVGSTGPETEALHSLVESLQLTTNVMFLSGLKDEELKWLYSQADLFIIPSSTEGFCLPLVEAMTFSCPAVCSDIPVFREVGDTRCRYFTLNENAKNNLVEAMAAELNNSRKREPYTETRFSREAIAHRLLHFYQSL
ncbi:MAG: glycosyltransferase family 1 protein [Cyanobacteria bacterium J06634_6]